jgi:hypothetical protein
LLIKEEEEVEVNISRNLSPRDTPFYFADSNTIKIKIYIHQQRVSCLMSIYKERRGRRYTQNESRKILAHYLNHMKEKTTWSKCIHGREGESRRGST